MTKPSSIITAAAMLAIQSSGSVPLPYPTGPNNPLDMAQIHEKSVLSGIGEILPLEIPFVTQRQGVITLDAYHGFPVGFIAGLAPVDFYGVDTWPVNVFMDENGVFQFQNAEGELFWQVFPASPTPYDPLWLFGLKGGSTLASRLAAQGATLNHQQTAVARMQAVWDPSRVVSEWTFVIAADAPAYRAARAVWEDENRLSRQLQPSNNTPPRSGSGNTIGDEEMLVTEFSKGSNAFHLAFTAGENIAKGYDGIPAISVLNSKDLTFPVGDWIALTNVPPPVVAGDTNSVVLPFAFIPGFTNSVSPLHDNTCVAVTNTLPSFLNPLVCYTNVIYQCGHPAAAPGDRGFFRLGLKEDMGNIQGVSRLWLARYDDYDYDGLGGGPAHGVGLLSAATANPGILFDVVQNDPLGLTLVDYHNNKMDLNNKPVPQQYGDLFCLPFRIFGDYASWTMTIQGQGPTDEILRTLSTAFPGQSNEKDLYFPMGNRYLIKMNWTGSRPGNDFNWYCWEARVGRWPWWPTSQTYSSYEPTRLSGFETFTNPHVYIDNTDGLLTDHVHMNDDPSNSYGYGGGGNVAQGLEAKFYTIKYTFETPAGDPATEPNDSGTGQNQYTFTTEYPNGRLTILLMVKVEPPEAAEKLEGHCYFVVDDIPGSIKKWHDVTPNGKAVVEGYGCLAAEVEFEKLPSNNNSFGWKTAKLMFGGVNGIQVASTQYGVFFPKNGYNHPTCNSCFFCPNWFYYWKQGGVCGIPQDCVYAPMYPEAYGFVIPQQDSTIRLCDRASDRMDGPEKFFSGNPTYGSIQAGGYGKGIECVYRTILHENEHLEIFRQFKNSIGTFQDLDEDWIPNTQETTYGGITTDPFSCDTYKVKTPPDPYGDQNIRCYLKEMEPIESGTIFPEKDWANPGCQHADQWGPFLSTTP